MVPENRHFITALFIFLALTVASCGGGGGGGSSMPVQPVTPTDPQNQVQYEVVPLLAGKGQVTSLVTYSNNLYWSDEYYGNGIWKYSVSDNTAPVLLVPRLHTPEIIVVHGNYFYWVDTFADTGFVGKKLLYKTTLDGSQTTLLREGNVLQSTTNQILVDDTAIYWANGSGYYSPVQIEKVPLDGSNPQTIYTASNVVRAISMDADHIYWLEQGAVSGYTLFRIAKAGGTVETLCQGLIDSGCVLIDPSINMTVYNNSVYLGLAGQVIKVPSVGGSPSVMAQSSEVCPMGITVYDSNLYWLNYSRSALPAYGGEEGILSAPTDTTGSFSVIVANLGVSRGLHVSSDGLSWAEADQNYTYKLKRLSWGSQSSDTLATGIYFWSSDLAGSQLYFTEIFPYAHYSQIGKISFATGTRGTLYGGLTNDSATLVPTDNYLVFGDGYALKKVPVDGGRVDTLLVGNNINNITFNHLYQKNGMIYYSSGGIYKIPLLDGGSATLLANDVSSSDIISIQDNYVYYACLTGAWPPLAELHRVAIDGGTPEVVFKVQTGKELLAFDGITTAYLKEWIWNDQYKLLKHDIATGQETQLYSGRIHFRGMNVDAVFIDDWNGWVYRIPKDGGTLNNILTVPYPLTLDPYWINAGAEDFYFSISYLEDYQGYFSEIDLLKRIK
jgi:hypothetical protein